ncbi:hypothetical protein Cs7R123_75300 [Catellatospora sp. TT07R-123]|uniref:hypothetical protein n=1 Tax=Catellatospora sp. TT07R-123 TaxID=2733863 RepID=UPI001B1F163F|nr:hypothetical protein [Catellatospora sp. TT07R-123]GHJ50188.1 hypothetical protein Cs7R123_75300 [Catellatospora sp. TT07R-123]
MEMTNTITLSVFASACAPTFALPVNPVLPVDRALVASVPAVASPLAAQLIAQRQLHWTPRNPILATAAAGAPVLMSNTSITSSNSTTKGYRKNESEGVKLDGFGGVPPRGIPV